VSTAVLPVGTRVVLKRTKKEAFIAAAQPSSDGILYTIRFVDGGGISYPWQTEHFHVLDKPKKEKSNEE
jgi:hypothetical protein